MHSDPHATDLFARASRYQALWEAIAVSIRPHISADTYSRWFSALEITDANEKELTLRVPNSIHRIWIESNYLQLLQEAITTTLGAMRRLRFVIQDEPGLTALDPAPVRGPINTLPATSRGPATVAERPAKEEKLPAASGLNPRFTFDSFVVGPSLEFAHAAAQAVAKKPAVAHNPLFMYGGVGLGKTHLMQAIGHSVLATKPGKKVLYVT
ncbi:MAG: chromosomal replication initiator protein DnaA, partial [Verrucomicrobia bacterium]|nr:chromosomal replication initiator protein DnaA [Verrucomicrobiota bacterium]